MEIFLIFIILLNAGIIFGYRSYFEGLLAKRRAIEDSFGNEPEDLDPDKDAALLGEHTLARVTLFDLLQRGLINLEDDKFKKFAEFAGH